MDKQPKDTPSPGSSASTQTSETTHASNQPSTKALRARHKTKPTGIDNWVGPIKIVDQGGIKRAEPCGNTVSFQLIEYNEMFPQVHQVRSIIRAKGNKITVTQLERMFRGTALGKWADRDEWRIMQEEFRARKGKVAAAGEMTRAIIGRKMGLTDATVKTNLSRARKEGRTLQHPTRINRKQP